MNITRIQVSLSADEKTATIRLSGRSEPIVCGVLGVEMTADSRRVVYLNSRFHKSPDSEYSGWAPTGAISTILTEKHDVA